MKKYSLGMVLLAFSFLTVHFTCSKIFDFCPQISSAFSSQVVYADTALSENDQGKIKEYYKLARQYYKRGDYERAIIECQKVHEIDQYNAGAHRLLKKAQVCMQRKRKKELEEQRKKEELVKRQAEKQKQKKLDELFDIARSLYSDEKYNEAIAQCVAILKMDSDNKSAQKLITKSEERTQIARERELANKGKLAEQARLEAQKQAEKDRKLKEEAREEKIDRLVREAKQLYSNKDYSGAMSVSKEVLLIDPENNKATKMIEKMRSDKAQLIEEQKELAQKRAEEIKREQIELLFKQADESYGDKDYKQALTIYQKVLSIDSGNKKALKMADKTREKIDVSEQEAAEKTSKLAKQKAEEDTEKEADLIALQKKKIEERRQIEREELESKIETRYRNGKKLYRNDEYSDAIKEFNAVLSLDSAHEGAKEYLKASEESLREQNERESAQQAKTAKKQIERKEVLKKRDIQDRITDAKIKADAGEYDEAIKILEEILPDVLDENLRRSVELLISKARTEKTIKEENLSRKRLQTISDERMLEVTKAQLPPAEVKRRKELERKKERAGAAIELKDKASSIKVPLVKYTGTDLRDVVLFLIKQTGINIVVDEAIFSGGASAQAAPAAEQAEGWAGEAAVAQPTGSVNTKVTCFLQDMTLLSVLEAILRPKGLDYKFTKEYIWISTNARILTQPLEDLETRVYPLEYGSSMNIKRLTESGFKTTAEEQATGLGAAGEETGGVAGAVSGESIKALLEALVPQPTGASITVQSELNKLFVKNTPENLDKTEKILAELRTPVQVSIEARYVYVRLQEGEDIGIGFKDITGTYNKNQAKPETAVKGVHGTSGTLQKTHTFTGDVLSGITGLGTTGLNMTYAAVLNRIQFTSVLRALQSRADTNTLSAPKLTVLNNKPGIVRFVETVTYVDTVTSTTAAATTTSAAITTYDYTFTDKDVGMILNVTPQVNEATNCVTLYLQPVVSNVESWSTPYYSSSSDTTGYRKPNFYSKDIETYVTVHDGDTIVLGGFMEDASGKTVYKVPFLSDIPLLGKLFQHKVKSNDKKKLLIFVTVSILDASGNARITPQDTL
ncbi:MAG: hypothetical protein Q7J67_10095 [bacterium]|nr:hypothetical protein [bacterium]